MKTKIQDAAGYDKSLDTCLSCFHPRADHKRPKVFSKVTTTPVNICEECHRIGGDDCLGTFSDDISHREWKIASDSKSSRMEERPTWGSQAFWKWVQKVAGIEVVMLGETK